MEKPASRRRLLALAMACAMPLAAVGADAQAGRAKAIACGVCHGPLGVAVAPNTPSLAGQPAAYLAAQLRQYRSGARRHERMSLVAKPLTDAEIDDLAAWFSSIRIEATLP